MSFKLTPDMLPFVGKTRDGQRVHVTGMFNVNYKCAMPFYGCIDHLAQTTLWNSDGEFKGGGMEHPFDIVSEWKEPIRHKAWVVLFRRIGEYYSSKDCFVYYNKEDAKRRVNRLIDDPEHYKFIGILETNEITEEV